MNTTTFDIDVIVRRARAQQLRQQGLLVFFGIMCILNLLFAGWLLYARTGGLVMLPALALSAVSALLLLRQWRRLRAEQSRHAALAQPSHLAVKDALAATLERRREYQRLRVMVPAVLLPLFGVALFALWQEGKMSGIQVAEFSILLGAISLALLVVIGHRIGQLAARCHSFEELARQFDA